MNKTKLYKRFNTALSILVATTLLYLLFTKGEDQFSKLSLLNNWQQLSQSIGIVCIVLIFTFMNWTIETIKWNSEVKKIQTLSTPVLIKSILIGITASAITPFRVGDIAARLFFIDKSKRRTVLYINAFMASSQLLITVIFGIIALAISDDILTLIGFPITIDLYFLLLLVPLLLWLYFKGNMIFKLMNARGFNRLDIVTIKKRSRLRILILSFSRYLVFCIQFYLVVNVFDPSIDFLLSTKILALIFIVKALLPTSFLSEVAVRISVSYFIFEMMGLQGNIGVVSNVIIWLFNLFIPAIVGAFMLSRIQWLSIANND